MPRGRPPEVDRPQIVAVALTLFERKGFDAVTMDAVARAAGVSRRTLFRHFPAKADLVWDGLGAVIAGVKSVPKAAPLEAVFAVGLKVFEDRAAAQLAMRKLRLIAASPALFNHPVLGELQAVLTARVKGHGSAPAALVGQTLFAAGFAAVLWWVQHPRTMSVQAAVQSALAALPRGRP